MTGNFPYFYVSQNNDALNIDCIENCCIRAADDDGREYALIVRTSDVGITRILSVGPLLVTDDSAVPLSDFKYTYSFFPTKQGKIEKSIREFLLNKKPRLTQAFECDIEEVKGMLIDIASTYLSMIGE